MSNRTALAFIGLLLAGLLGWGVYELLTNYERDYLEIRTGSSAEARRNPFLAAQRFLQRLEIEAESVSGRDRLLNLPAEPGVLLVNHFGPSLPPDREQALLDWIRAGGHLIVMPTREWDEETESGGNRLLDGYGVRLRSPVSEEDKEEDEDEKPVLPFPLDDQASGETLAVVEHPDLAEPIQVAFAENRLLDAAGEAADWVVPVDEGQHLLQFHTGNGRLTVLSDMGFLSNDGIGKQDHAFFLALLVGEQRRVWLLYTSNMPSLLSLLWKSAPFFVASLVLLSGLWLWRLTLRTGPLLHSEDRVRRSLMEHLDAAAGYAWKTDRAGRLVQRTRSAIEQEWIRRHPQLALKDAKARSVWIAKRTEMAPRAVEAALYGRIENEQDFIRSSAVQQKLTARLAFGSGEER